MSNVCCCCSALGLPAEEMERASGLACFASPQTSLLSNTIAVSGIQTTILIRVTEILFSYKRSHVRLDGQRRAATEMSYEVPRLLTALSDTTESNYVDRDRRFVNHVIS